MSSFSKIMYFILALASLAVLACIAYAGLPASWNLPAIEVVTEIASLFAIGALSFWTCIPLMIMTLLAFVNFFNKDLRIIFFVILIIVVAVDVIVLFFPQVFA